MPGLEPFNDTEKLYYPSGQQPLLPGIYDVNSLTSAGDRLYSFEVGDFAYPVLTPVPHVELTIFTLNPNTVTITVYRTAKNRIMPVRGQVGVYAVGGRNVVDWEAPFGILLSYRAEQFDNTGQSLGFTAAFTTQLDVDDTWVQNPFDPAGAIQVTMEQGAAATLPSSTPADVYWPVGSGTAVAITGQKRALTDVPIPFLTFTEEDGDAVRDMLGNPYETPSLLPVLVIRTGIRQKKMRLPQPFIALIAEPGETPLDAQQGGSLIKWDCTATEINAPAPALVGSVLTYEDFDATYPDTYESEDAAYSTYLEADRDYSIAGTAGEQDNA